MIVGYSINATIVIFDRIRENLKSAGKKADLKELVNEYYSDTDQKYLYILHYIYYHICSICYGCIFLSVNSQFRSW